MLWGRWISFGSGFLLITGGFLLGAVSAWSSPEMGQYAAATALTLGAMAGLVPFFVIGRREAAIKQIISQLNGVTRQLAESEVDRSGEEPQESAADADRSLQELRHRIEALGAKKRELELQLRMADAQRQYSQTVLDSIADAVLVTNPRNQLTLANQAAARVLGFDLEQALRQPVDQVVRDPHLGELIRDMRHRGDDAPRRQVEHRLAGTAKEAVFDVTLQCVTGSSPRCPSESGGVVAILRDVTCQREVARMKSDFISSVSHELRTPLSSIRAYLEMLLDGEARDETTRQEFYHILQAEATRLSRLIDNILNLSHIESGLMKARHEPVNLVALVRDAIGLMTPQARAKQVKLEEMSAPRVFQVSADRDMIFQVMLNLLGNAVKYTPAGGKVSVSLQDDLPGRRVRVSVADTGVGIPPQALPYLFDKFYRVPEHRRIAGGTGLGLHLVKQIVEKVHDGRIDVASRPGMGSTFTFDLPMADNQ